MAKKHKCKEEDEEAGADFMTSFADMMTLLMAFFVLLFAMSTVDEQKFVALLKGLEANFGNSALQDGLLNGGESILGANLEAGSAIPVPGGSLSLIEEPNAEINGSEEPDLGEGEQVELEPGEEEVVGGGYLTRKDLEEVEKAVQQALEDTGFAEDVAFRFNERGLVISVATDEVLFAPSKSDLQEGSLEILDVISEQLLDFPNIIWVDGHTDAIPFPNPEHYDNKRLSSDRANAVVNYMTYKQGLPSNRLIPVGFGADRPLVDNATPENRAKNRRVEIVISAGNSGTAEADAEVDAAQDQGAETQIDDPGDDGLPQDVVNIPVSEGADAASPAGSGEETDG
jgi:chemotaxis protein MotB